MRYLVDPNTSYAQVVQERDENNVLQARYAWEDGFAPLVMWRRTNTGAYATFFYLCDGQDSVRQLTDAAGRVTDSYFYDAFGNGLQGGSGDTPNSFRYTGQQLDPSGDYYLRARYYNVGSGRFLSHDPIQGYNDDPVTLHRYLYSGNDPVQFSDPGGEEFSLGGMMASSSIASSIRSVSSAIYQRIYSRAKDTLLYGPQVATQNLAYDAIEDATGVDVQGAMDSLSLGLDLISLIRDLVNDTEAAPAPALAMMSASAASSSSGSGANGPLGFSIQQVIRMLKGTEALGIVTGPYSEVAGHHILSDATFDTRTKEALCMPQNEFTKDGRDWSHARTTREQGSQQRRLNQEIAAGTKTNSMREQTRIAYKSLIAGGVPKAHAIVLAIRARNHMSSVAGLAGPTRKWGDGRSNRNRGR